MERIKLELIGITYNQIESGVYAVLLQEYGGRRRIPIVIGYPEAQAIECKLQEIITPRPLTHDLMANVMSSFGVSLHEINIFRLPNGVFAAEMILTGNGKTVTIDSRSSDAIALAIRVGAPIYTTAELLDEVGIDPDEKGPTGKKSKAERKASASKPPTASFRPDMKLKSVEELKADMQRAAEQENYEEAARLKAEIDLRTKQTDSDEE